MLGLCPIHNEPEYTNVSRKVREILHENKRLSQCSFCRLTVHKWEGGVETAAHDYFLEKEDVLTLGLPFDTVIHLNDRDIEKKSLNDRFVIQKMRLLLSTVCMQCIAPLKHLNLWGD
ncbi:hypothetical protein ACP26C_12220 [Franconibacter helveticus 513]|uniref:hypothetical protein n=1 Tax=Franconibacter helveticus TaxID=357240 RepID=UPI000467EC52|nr:hypothetical protein [Franconibacter helveticus]